MMDSRAKNMFFDTIDGNIWYPRMYDMDTCYGLNNEGVLNFGYGLEQHDENIYNGENSLFWNNFEECYSQEIKDFADIKHDVNIMLVDPEDIYKSNLTADIISKIMFMVKDGEQIG